MANEAQSKRQAIFQKTINKIKQKRRKLTPSIKEVMIKALFDSEDAVIKGKRVDYKGYVVALNEDEKHLIVFSQSSKIRLGQGNYTTIDAYLDEVTGDQIALKSIKPGKELTYNSAKREYSILKGAYKRAADLGLKVVGIQKNFFAFIDDETSKLGGISVGTVYDTENLFDKLLKNPDFISFKEKMDGAKQLLSGLALMSRIGLSHGDIKPENIFLRFENDKWEFNLADFGGAIFYDEIDLKDERFISKPAGIFSPYYTPYNEIKAAEAEGKAGNLIKFEEIERKRDVFAMGVVLFALFTGKLPFEKKSDGYPNVTEELSPKLLKIKGVKEETIYLIQRMLTKSPLERLSAEEVLKTFEESI